MKEIATILGVPVVPYTMDEAVTKLTQDTLQRKRNFVVTANAEIIMMAQDDKDYKTLLAETYDLYLRLLEEAARNKIPVYFFGGKPGIAEEAAAEGKRRWPGLHVAGCRNGYFSAEEEPEIIEDINRSGAAMLFAALGAPKQEKWLAQYRDRLKPSLLMGIGGSFDVLAGKMQRAPKWMQDAKLEWLFRLMKQPSRFGRMLALPKFVFAVRDEKSKKK